MNQKIKIQMKITQVKLETSVKRENVAINSIDSFYSFS